MNENARPHRASVAPKSDETARKQPALTEMQEQDDILEISQAAIKAFRAALNR